jgi:hypothetical protein
MASFFRLQSIGMSAQEAFFSMFCLRFTVSRFLRIEIPSMSGASGQLLLFVLPPRAELLIDYLI